MCIEALLLCLTSVCHYFWAVLLCVTLLIVTYSVGVEGGFFFLSFNSSEFFFFLPTEKLSLSKQSSSSLFLRGVRETDEYIGYNACEGGETS